MSANSFVINLTQTNPVMFNDVPFTQSDIVNIVFVQSRGVFVVTTKSSQVDVDLSNVSFLGSELTSYTMDSTP